MKRLLLALLVMLLLYAPAHGTTRTAASCNATAVQATINLSSNGDTVLVPGGTCAWDTGANKVTISSSQQITLNGQGTTTINFSGSGTDPGFGATVLSITTGAVANTFLTGFTFNGAFINGRAPIQINTSSNSLTFRMFGNTLNYTGAFPQGTFLLIIGDGPGLIDHNNLSTTINFTEMIHNFGSNTQVATWSSDVVPGGPNNVFLEDNTFTGPGNGNPIGTMAIESFNGARTVFRHNTTNNVGFDVHGLSLAAQFQPPNNPNSCAYVNTRWWEVYVNNFNFTGTTTNFSPLMAYRGGSGVIYDNTTSGINLSSPRVQFQADCVSATGPPYPYQDQPGQGITTSSGSSTTHSSPMYMWNNVGFTQNVFNGSPYIQQNRDYFVSATKPVSLTRCESAADVAIGCPVTYAYTPYTYPHPLTVGNPAPAVQLSRTLINFGAQNTGTSSANVNTVLTNSGTANLTVSSIAVTGTDAANYSINTNTCTVTITPGSTCSFNTVCTPTGVGTFNNAFATVTSNAATSPNDKVTLNCTGQAPITVSISVTPSPIVFGNQIQGVASAPVTVTVKSIGTGSFTFGTPYAQIVAGGSNPVPADFGLAAPGGTPCSNGLVLAPTVSCTFTVTAILSQLTLETAQLNVNGPPNASVSISGTGLSPQNAPAPAPAIFVNYPFQRVMDITVTNCSNPCKVRVTCVSGCSSNVGMTAGLN